MRTWTLGSLAFALATIQLSAPASVAKADDFYKNRQMKLVIGTGIGGSYNHVARTVARHLSRNIPGGPTIIAQNMQGASSSKAANFVYNAAPQDGSVLLAVVQTLPQNQLFGFKNVKYDVSKFHWIGNPGSSAVLFAVWHRSPVKTIDDAKSHQVVFGAASARGTDGLLPVVINNVLGTKFKIVTGYKGSGVVLAIERGEIEGRGGLSWGGWQSLRPDWIRDGKIRFLLQFALKAEKDLPNVPLAIDLAKTDEQRQILRLFSTAPTLGYPLLTGPGVPADRVALLRHAFRRTMGDPRFLADAKRSGVHVAPTYGEELQELAQQLVNYSPAIVAKAKKAMKRK
jgi:tripartite-type tricarboxylate transporter receptor subunit TctC